MKNLIAVKIKDAIDLAFPENAAELKDFSPEIDNNKNPEHGDFCTTAAMGLAKTLKKNPLEIAQKIADGLSVVDKTRLFSKVEVVRGYINLFISNETIFTELEKILSQKEKYLLSDWGKGKKVLLEFVSANPTGPLHIGHGRWAVLGDNIARVYAAAGMKVTKEFYVNDVGHQIDMLIASVKASADGQPTPEGGYGGYYVKELADRFKKDLNKKDFKKKLLSYITKHQKEVLASMGVKFDSWFSEESLHNKGKVKHAIKELEVKGRTYEKDGALWFRSTDYGDDKDRVLIKEQGASTYFAADVAYHANKFERGFDRIIDIWGTDHHGYVKRIYSAMEAMGFPKEKLEIIIGQLVTLYRGTEVVRMSKRTGEMVTLEEVVEETGSDATRFYLSANDENTHVDFDLQLAKEKSQDNPVYYVQYAHARICSILAEAKKRKMTPRKIQVQKHLVLSDSERKLLRRLIDLPAEVALAAQKSAPHRLIQYLKDVSVAFHHFYQFNRVLEDNHEIRQNRLALAIATRIILSNVLKLLGMSAPERM
jgi:arginyl-tRNA synthetase